MKNIFKNIFSRKTDDIKVGDTVEITACYYFHDFPIGEKVTVTEIRDTSGVGSYICADEFDWWLLGKNEFRKVEPPKQPLNKLAVFASAVLFVTALIIAFMPSNSAADMGKVIVCAAGLIGLAAVVYFFIYDPLTDHFCDSIDNANSLTENEDEWLGL